MKRLFVLGDSISIHYGPFLKKYLAGSFEYSRKGQGNTDNSDLNSASSLNGGDSKNCLSYLIENSSIQCEILLLNCGLHDIKTIDRAQVSIEEYQANLQNIIRLLKDRKITPVWAASTPVYDTIHNERCKSFKRYNKDILQYNEKANEIMAEYDIPSIDLYTFTKNLGGMEIYIDHVHFTDDVRKLQAAFIAGHLQGITF